MGLVWGQRNRSCRGFALAGFDVRRALSGVFGGGQCIRRRLGFLLRLGEVAFEVCDAPAATGSRAATLAQLTGDARAMDPDEVHDLPLGDVKAVTNRVVEFQGEVP